MNNFMSQLNPEIEDWVGLGSEPYDPKKVLATTGLVIDNMEITKWFSEKTVHV